MTIREKNLMVIMDLMNSFRVRQGRALILDIEAHCGVVDKKAYEYIKLLVHINKLKEEYGYIFIPGYYELLVRNKQPIPGSPVWYVERNRREIEDFNKRYEAKKKEKKDNEEELSEEEKQLLGG